MHVSIETSLRVLIGMAKWQKIASSSIHFQYFQGEDRCQDFELSVLEDSDLAQTNLKHSLKPIDQPGLPQQIIQIIFSLKRTAFNMYTLCALSMWYNSV